MKGMLATLLFNLKGITPTMDFCFSCCYHTFGTTILGNTHRPFSVFNPKRPGSYVQDQACCFYHHTLRLCKIISYHQNSCQVTHLELSLSFHTQSYAECRRDDILKPIRKFSFFQKWKICLENSSTEPSNSLKIINYLFLQLKQKIKYISRKGPKTIYLHCLSSALFQLDGEKYI